MIKIHLTAQLVILQLVILNCFMLLSFLKVKKNRNKDAKKLLKEHARSLLNDIDRYWLFLYEALPKDDLTGDYKCLKNNRISFVKPEFK